MTSCSIETRRARPLLGTLVEIRVQGTGISACSAVNAAFDTIEAVHQAMSFHHPESELSRLNRNACGRAVKVSPALWNVLSEALRVAKLSGGAFDPTVGACLVNWKILPAPQDRTPTHSQTSWKDVRLLPGRRVRFNRPLWLDLGGIAKGYAVDLAVCILRGHSISAGVVNAGGDLRVFGSRAERVHVRHPDQPARLVPLADLSDGALATTATYFSAQRCGGRRVNALVNPLLQRPCSARRSVSVQAPTCMLADALTKVVLVHGNAAKAMLRRCHASAMVLEGARAWRLA
jgi:FAD:protein FMN transferase